MTDTAPRTPPSLDNPPESAADGTMTGLVSGILDDAHTLVIQQFEMLKAEAREDFQRSKRAAEFGGLGVVLLTVGILGLVTGMAIFLHEQFQYSLWASWAIIGGLSLILGAALATVSYVLLERFNPLPTKTFHALQENLKWKTK